MLSAPQAYTDADSSLTQTVVNGYYAQTAPIILAPEGMLDVAAANAKGYVVAETRMEDVAQTAAYLQENDAVLPGDSSLLTGVACGEDAAVLAQYAVNGSLYAAVLYDPAVAGTASEEEMKAAFDQALTSYLLKNYQSSRQDGPNIVYTIDEEGARAYAAEAAEGYEIDYTTLAASAEHVDFSGLEPAGTVEIDPAEGQNAQYFYIRGNSEDFASAAAALSLGNILKAAGNTVNCAVSWGEEEESALYDWLERVCKYEVSYSQEDLKWFLNHIDSVTLNVEWQNENDESRAEAYFYGHCSYTQSIDGLELQGYDLSSFGMTLSGSAQDGWDVSMDAESFLSYRNRLKGVTSFDRIGFLDENGDYNAENLEFGNDTQDYRHFDKYLLAVLEENAEELAPLYTPDDTFGLYETYEDMLAAFREDSAIIENGDAYYGYTGSTIVELYNPLRYILDEETEQPSWARIVHGTQDRDVSLAASQNDYIAWTMMGVNAHLFWSWDNVHVAEDPLDTSKTSFIDAMAMLEDGTKISYPVISKDEPEEAGSGGGESGGESAGGESEGGQSAGEPAGGQSEEGQSEGEPAGQP